MLVVLTGATSLLSMAWLGMMALEAAAKRRREEEEYYSRPEMFSSEEEWAIKTKKLKSK